MAREYRILVAKTQGGIVNLAAQENWTLQDQPAYFKEIDTLHDNTLGPIGRVFTALNGWVALAYRE